MRSSQFYVPESDFLVLHYLLLSVVAAEYNHLSLILICDPLQRGSESFSVIVNETVVKYQRKSVTILLNKPCSRKAKCHINLIRCSAAQLFKRNRFLRCIDKYFHAVINTYRIICSTGYPVNITGCLFIEKYSQRVFQSCSQFINSTCSYIYCFYIIVYLIISLDCRCQIFLELHHLLIAHQVLYLRRETFLVLKVYLR